MTDYELRRVPTGPGVIVDAVYDVVVDDVVVGRIMSHPPRRYGAVSLAGGWSSHVYDPDRAPGDPDFDWPVADRGAAHARTWPDAVANLLADRAAYLARRDRRGDVSATVADDPWSATG